MKMVIKIFILLLLLAGCEKRTLTVDQQSEYIQRISKALFSNDVVFISSTIDYIDAIIRFDGHTAILSIYYDKARLLYRLKRFDEALEMLSHNKESMFNRYIRAALLIRLKRDDEAGIIMAELKNDYLNELSMYENGHPNRGSPIQAILGLILLMDQDYEFEINELIDKGIITEQEVISLKKLDLTKGFILQSLWPE